MNVSVQANTQEFNATLKSYAELSGKTFAQVVAKKGADLGFELGKELRAIAPGKGAIRSEMLGMLAAGRGIKIRPAILAKTMARGKVSQTISGRNYRFGKSMRGTTRSGGSRLNFWALAAKAEINLRESGRKFVGYSAGYASLRNELAARDISGLGYDFKKVLSDRYNRLVSKVGFTVQPNETSMAFRWGGSKVSGDLAKAMQKPKARTAVSRALDTVTKDMLVYIARKLNEQRAGGAA